MGKKSRLIVRGATLLLPLLLGLSCFSRYNKIAGLRDDVDNGWARVENAIEERNYMVPGMVSAVKGYAPHESAVFDAVTQARFKLAGATNADELVEADKAMRDALAGLHRLVERYPPLEADHDFIRIRGEVADAESRIMEGRLDHGRSVRRFNAFVSKFPNDLLAGILNFERAEEAGNLAGGNLSGADGN